MKLQFCLFGSPLALRMRLILSLLLILHCHQFCNGLCEKNRVKRGFRNHGGGFLGGYAPGYGSGPAGQEAGIAALHQIHQNQAISLWAAQSAVSSAVGRDYQHQLATTRQFANAFSVPLTKSQAGHSLKGVGNQQRGAQIHAAQAGRGVQPGKSGNKSKISQLIKKVKGQTTLKRKKGQFKKIVMIPTTARTRSKAKSPPKNEWRPIVGYNRKPR